jgi:hypothetical protein
MILYKVKSFEYSYTRVKFSITQLAIHNYHRKIGYVSEFVTLKFDDGKTLYTSGLVSYEMQ